MTLGRTSIACGLMPMWAGLAVFVVLFACNLNGGTSRQMAEARYLPTRSDPAELETLKTIIRNLLIESATNSRLHPYRGQPQPQPQQPYPDSAGLTYLQRRAAEMSVGSSNGEEYDGYPAGAPLSPAAEAAGVQLFKQPLVGPKSNGR